MNELKDYLLGELDESERRSVEERLAADADYRLEYKRLTLTQQAMLAAPEPEMPRRIAFVSDPVFENKPNFWQRLFAPAWAYGCAAMLSAAILGHGYLARPAEMGGAGLDEVAIQARIDKAAANAAAKAVAEVRAESDRRHEQMVVAVEKTFDYMRKESMRVQRASYEEGRR